MITELDHSGPIDYLVVEFPGNKMTGEGFPLLLDLVDRGIVRVLDLVFLTKDAEGDVAGIDVSNLDTSDTFDMTVFDGAASGLVDSDDIAQAGAVLEPSCSAAILVYENLWAAPFATALRRGGAQLVASGRIPVQAILAALDAQDAATSS